MALADVHHQATAQGHIQRALARDRIPHAYLFHGPDGVGKEKLAVGLAQLLLCENPTERELVGDQTATVGLDRLRDGCGECDACHMVAAETHPDLHLIYRQLNRDHPDPDVRRRKALEIGVDVLRHFVIQKVGLTPTLQRAKVFIVREADRMNSHAQNALLKTLEEPPGATIIILLVTATDRLLPTTLSRCQVVRFDTLPLEFVRTRLAEQLTGLPAEQVAWYAHIGAGSLGRAMRCAEDELFDVNRRLLVGMGTLVPSMRETPAPESRGALTKSWMDEAKALGDLHRKRDPEISDTEAARRGLKAIFELASNFYADLLRLGSGSESVVVNATGLSDLEAAAQAVDVNQAVKAVNRLAAAERQLDLNVNTQLCVEVLINDLAGIFRGSATSAV